MAITVAPQDPTPPWHTRVNKPLLLVLLVVLVAALAWRCSASTSADKTAIAKACHHTIVGQLKSPGTAHFEHESVKGTDGTTLHDDGGSYVVSGSVDSQNSFGALLRSAYTCDVSGSDGGGWAVLDYTFADGGSGDSTEGDGLGNTWSNDGPGNGYSWSDCGVIITAEDCLNTLDGKSGDQSPSYSDNAPADQPIIKACQAYVAKYANEEVTFLGDDVVTPPDNDGDYSDTGSLKDDLGEGEFSCTVSADYQVTSGDFDDGAGNEHFLPTRGDNHHPA